ncbi:hypothetical protein [Helicobacter sp. T3_23-1056]
MKYQRTHPLSPPPHGRGKLCHWILVCHFYHNKAYHNKNLIFVITKSILLQTKKHL